MKDQHRLVCKCRMNDIPAFVLCGTDTCALQALREYYNIATEKGCSSEFLDDLEALINDFEQFQRTEPEKIKIPD